ncbi:hypothetical protein [Gemella cuniculi]|uniref:hypothetical protein n=1 Tax=Gemella cuniculi TaxID=150240 RepID=UPI00040D0E3D|nr:hypothetical protein [Gemella cuniculi]
MKIKIITYVDNEKIAEEVHFGNYQEKATQEIIEYNDKNGKKINIFIDKIKESVSIEKDNLKTHIKYIRKVSDYSTFYGNIKIETQLVKFKKMARNNLVMYEVIYNIFLDEKNKQQNKLKILVQKN